MLAREHLWRLAPHRGSAADGRWRWFRYRYALAIPLLLALEAAASLPRAWRRLRLGAEATDGNEGPNGW
jgi:hypothetical protein